jgi:hypothetical protein
MQTIEYRTVDKSAWGPGEWADEPDKVQWQDEATGLPCLAVRNHHGVWCGYVGVAPGHPWHGMGYSDVDDDISVHGGLTFANACSPGKEEHGICHKPDPGEPEHVWWFGFDCGHCDDLIPRRYLEYAALPGEAYRSARLCAPGVRRPRQAAGGKA